MIIKNNLWIFGDSFSSQDFMSEEQRNLIRKGRPEFKALADWPWLVSEHFNLNPIYCGWGGKSTQQILYTVIEKLPNIVEGDYVSIGLSYPTRHYMTVNKAKKMKIIDINHDESHAIHSCGLFGDIQGIDNVTNKNILKDIWNKFVYFFHGGEDDDLHILTEYFMNLANSFKEHFNNNGIKCITWDFTEWGKYENWTDYTNGTFDDAHWSVNGHVEFSKKVITDFEDNH